MTRRPWSTAILLGILLVVAALVWAVSTRTRPSFAVYDSVSAPPAVRDTVRPEPADTGTGGPPAPAVAATRATVARLSRHVPVRARADSADTSGVRPHRSDNYGGYSGYGSRERRGDPNAR